MYWFECPKSLATQVSRLSIDTNKTWVSGILFKGVGDQRQDFLVLVEEQTCGEVSQALVGEAGGGQKLKAFDLAEMCPLSEGEEVKELRYVVAPAEAWI
jgi:hypothetical protein